MGEGRNGYSPWPSFAKAHYSPATFVLVSGAERVGKSVATAAEAFAWIPVSELIWMVAKQYRDTTKEMSYLAEACLNAGLTDDSLVTIRDDQASHIYIVDKGNIDPKTRRPRVICKITTRSLWDIERALVAEAPDLVIVAEAGLVDREPLEKLRLRVATRRGRVWMSGTLETAAEWFAGAYDRWQQWPNIEDGMAISVPLYENTQDFPGGAENPEIITMRNTFRPSVYSHRVEGKPSASELLVFRDTFIRGNRPFCTKRLRFRRHRPNNDRWPVQIAIDPGHNPSYYTVHFMQEQEDGEECVVGEIAMIGAYHEEVIRAARAHPCWENVVGGTIDPWAANQHGMGYRQTPWEIWKIETGMELRLPEPAPNPVQLIDRYLYFLRHQSGECKFFFDPEIAPRFNLEWKKWHYKRGPDGKPLREEPLKAMCDGIKGVGYYLFDKYGAVQRARDDWRRKPAARPWRLR